MSTGGLSRHRSISSTGKLSTNARHTPPPTTLTPENTDATLEPCAATASFLLYAQRNQILVLHHDTLAIERRFDLHREDVVWITVDNVSDRGSGRLAVSYDAGNTAIVWDILSGGEVARFSAYEHMKVASFMRNGNIAFGNDQGNIILFELGTSEHVSARTIFDPITAIAPSVDCRTFAIGYLNGSILVATLQPSFTILHTLTTTRAPSRITGLAWHGSSSKQKTDMLATQTMDGDLRVWSVPKPPLQELPTVIRVLHRADIQQPGPCWFAWSKNGRIVQHAEGETRTWDVRTKKVSWETVPTVEGVTGIASFGPTANLFTLSHGHRVQQYDVNPSSQAALVASVQHVPANTPPTPPTMLDERKNPYMDSRTDEIGMAGFTDTTGESSADEAASMSPLQKIAREMDSLDALESELRDKVMPLSPTSSRASSVSSRSSGARRPGRKYLYDRPSSSRASTTTGDGTEFSLGGQSSYKQGRESMSIRSVSSYQSTNRNRTSALRKEVLRSPEEAKNSSLMDLFPHARARLKDVPFRTPHYGNVARTPELLQREMLSVIFGWNDTARSLVRDEMQRHKAGSASGVLLSKWLGDMGADSMASMVGSESMSSSDWMLLALSSIGQDSQKKVGEAFVQRLLEKGDVHPAVAILIGLGEFNDAIEVYVAQSQWLEATLLTCLMCPADWPRISYLIRRWGETAVQYGQAELAVRCFSCTSIETSEPWFSPRAQDAVYTEQQRRLTEPPSSGGLTSPPLSPPSRSGSGRLAAKNAALKLITSFGDKGAPLASMDNAVTPMHDRGVTPIAQSALHTALSPGGAEMWQQPTRARNVRDPSSARTATPGGFSRRKRLPSKSDIERAKQEAAEIGTPITAARETIPPVPAIPSRRTSSVSSNNEPATAVKPSAYDDRLAPENARKSDDQLPSPAQGVFSRLREDSRPRNKSIERKPDGLSVQVVDTRYTDPISPGPSTNASGYTSASAKSGKGRAIDKYISSVDAAREQAREKRAQSRRRGESRKREESRPGRGTSRAREPSETQGQHGVTYIRPAKRSPSSPVPMSPEEIAQASLKPAPATSEDESFYKITSPVDSHKSMRSGRSEPKLERRRISQEDRQGEGRGIAATRSRGASRGASRQRSPAGDYLIAEDGRGRTEERKIGSTARSPSSPLPMPAEIHIALEQDDDTNSDGRRVRLRADSRTGDDLQTRRAGSRGRQASSGRKPLPPDEAIGMPISNLSKSSLSEEQSGGSSLSMGSDFGERRPRAVSRKELAARELEQRRLSLARRPSAPAIPLPGVAAAGAARPGMGLRSNTDMGNSPTTYGPPLSRSQTVDPEQMSRYGKITGTSTTSAPIGLPATPRAMRHPRYMSTDPNEREGTPPVPEIPDNISNLSSLGSSLSQVSNSNLGSNAPSNLTSNITSHMTNLTQDTSVLSSQYSQLDSEDGIAPLLPSTVFGQKGPQPPYGRAASAPPEKMAGGVHPAYKPTLPHSMRRLSQVRKISPPEPKTGPPVSSIDEALASDQVIIIPEEVEPPPMLPELQHLAGPPPPPPPPTMYGQPGHANSSGMISIAVDDSPSGPVDVGSTLPSTTYPQPMERATTASPNMHRRGRGSVSETFGSRFRGFGDRIVGDRKRSTSRGASRAKSPPQESGYRPSPYETVLPPMPSHHRVESIHRAKSPYEQAMAAQGSSNQDMIPPPPPPPPVPRIGMEGKLQEMVIPPSSLPRSQSAMGGYRNPKDIRANMPPETLQQGVYGGTFL